MKFDRKVITQICVIVFAVFLCSGCETWFVNPLSSQSQARPDDKLYGKWKCADEKNKNVSIQFDKGSNMETNISVFEKGSKDKNPAFTMFPTTVGKTTYMNLVPTNEDKGKGYLIAKYQVSGDTMTIWILDSEKMKTVITQGKLTGNPGSGTSSVTVSDTAEHVAAFLESPESEKTFEYFGSFKRLKK